MNIALFGGTFDPVHKGHLAVARAAVQRFQLGKVYFVPADVPPHRRGQRITSFHHRYAMLALATAGEKDFLPSLIESRQETGGERPSYTLDTVRRFQHTLRPSDRLFFLIGIDAFLEVATWHKPVELLKECDFIVASRPGFSLADVGDALPEGLRPPPAVIKAFRKQPAKGTIALGGTTLHILDQVEVPVSATAVRRAAASGKSLARFVAPLVAEYIRKMGLYRKQ